MMTKQLLTAILVIVFTLIITSLVNSAPNSLTANLTSSSSASSILNSLPSIRIRRPLNGNFTRRVGERIRLECEFELTNNNEETDESHHVNGLTYADFTLYWVKNYQELLSPKKNYIHIIRKNLTSILIMKNLEPFDSGSYMCVCELSSSTGSAVAVNSSSETTLIVSSNNNNNNNNDVKFKAKSFNQAKTGRKPNDLFSNDDYFLSSSDSNRQSSSSSSSSSSDNNDDDDTDNSDSDLFNDEFPSLNPTLVEQFDDKGFCEPYKGTVCAGIITSNYSVYSTSSQQQDMIEERLKTIIPLLVSNKNNLSKRCSTFAIPSLCLFAFPLCDRRTKQPKQICRFDCKQLQQDLCKNEYFNVRTLFESKLSDSLQNFLLDCNQLPPSSDSPNECLPIVSMTLDKLESSVMMAGAGGGKPADLFTPTSSGVHPVDLSAATKISIDKNLAQQMHILLPTILVPISLIFVFAIVCYCRKNTASSSNVGNFKASNLQSSNSTGSSNIQPSRLRMSNVSLHKSAKTKSSKSSIASSQQQQHQQQVEMNPFLGVGSGGMMKHQQHHHGLMSTYDNHMGGGQTGAYTSIPIAPPQLPPPPSTLTHQIYGSDSLPQIRHVSPRCLRLVHEIGKGRFGPVFVAEMSSPSMPSRVVVKTLVSNSNGVKSQLKSDLLKMQTTSTPNVHAKLEAATSAEEHFNEQEFYNEISLYSSLRNRYLANLIGVYTHNNRDSNSDSDDTTQQAADTTLLHLNSPQFMVFEHLNSGDLHEHLLSRGAQLASLNLYNMNGMAGSQSNLSAVSSSIGGASSQYANIHAQQQRNLADFLYIGQQIAAGMDYLSQQNYVHKDLATRNILMSDNLTVKISIDLLAQYKDQYAKDYYRLHLRNLPVRWIAPEALQFGKYSQQSDVWSYGVCLWEIFSLGAQPYAGCTNPEVIEMIQERRLLASPDDCPQRAYSLMLECWHEDPYQRPLFSQIVDQLRNWENYYMFNNTNTQVHHGGGGVSSTAASSNNGLMHAPMVPPLVHHHHGHHTAGSSGGGSQSNSQTSKASSLLGNTASTGVSSSSSPPPLPSLPPPPQPPPLFVAASTYAATNTATTFYSPSKQLQTNLFASKFNLLSSNGNNNNGGSPPSSSSLSTNQQQQQQQQRFFRAAMMCADSDPTGSLRLSQRQNQFINGMNSAASAMPPPPPPHHQPTLDNHHFDL